MLDTENTQDTTVLEQALRDSSVVEQEAKAPDITQPVAPQPKQEDHPNFRSLRDRLEQERKERERIEQRLAEIEAKNRPVQQEENFELDLKEDDVAEGRHLSKVGRKIKQLEQKIVEAEQKRVELQRKSEENTVISSIKMDFPDIDKVVNETTMAALAQKYPHLERTIKSSPDLYSKAAAAYQAIKDLGIYVEDNYAAERDRVQRNAAKPKPTAAAGGTPLSQADMFANGLTPELKDKLHKEMLDAIKSR